MSMGLSGGGQRFWSKLGLKATGAIASPVSLPLLPLRHRYGRHSRLDVMARACRMLSETLCAGDATSPGSIISFEVHNFDVPLFLEPWTLVQIITAPNIIDNLTPISFFPPVSTYHHAPPSLDVFFVRHILL